MGDGIPNNSESDCWVFGNDNDFLRSRSVVATDIILFGPSTFTKELWSLGLNDISYYGGSSRLAEISIGARQFG